jgi:L-fuculose-phosphate aldolase
MSTREDLIRYYRWLRQYGYNDSHSGNASVRVGTTIWVTPAGACADTLVADNLIKCHIGGECGQGASLDAPLHVRIYQKNAQAHAALHSHGPYSVALTLRGGDFTPLDFEGQLYFPTVPVITIPCEDYLKQSPEQVAHMLARHPITIVRRHGVYAWGKNLDFAYKWTCSLEQSAKTAFIARVNGQVDKLS